MLTAAPAPAVGCIKSSSFPKMPPKLNLEFSATVTTNQLNFDASGHVRVNTSVTKDMAASLSQLTVAVREPGTKPFNKPMTAIMCTHGVNELQVQPFFDEQVCYDMPMPGAPPGATQDDCFGHTLGGYMPLSGEVPGSTPGAYANSTFSRTVVDAATGDSLDEWVWVMEPAPKNGTMKINNVQFTVMQWWWQTFRTDANRVLRFLNSTSNRRPCAPTRRRSAPSSRRRPARRRGR